MRPLKLGFVLFVSFQPLFHVSLNAKESV
uniref:Uncharacterized protein n=1 Tax=Anguilla anguilla TaxID=7936 RepID=A0A0E9RM47_ANGAN